MRITALRDRGRFRIRLSRTEMGVLGKVIDAGLYLLEKEGGQPPPPLTTGERKAIAYWKGKNPFAGRALPKPRKRSRAVKKPSVGLNTGGTPKGGQSAV